MKRLLFWILFVLALASISYFVCYPYYIDNFVHKPAQVIAELESASVAQESFAQDGWVKIEKFSYQRRDIPSLEADFMAVGYPSFLYMTDSDGNLNLQCEKSFHENGMSVYLYMDDTYYMTHAQLEYVVPSNRFNSTSMGQNISPFYDFVRIVTGHSVSDEDQNALLRTFTDVFNETDNNMTHSVIINDLSFTITLDRFFNTLIIVSNFSQEL